MRKILPVIFVFITSFVFAARVAYIHGDVTEDGTMPSGSLPAYDQMLLTDTGDTGCSQFKTMVENEGDSIASYFDQDLTLNAAFLNQFDVIVFGLHQRVWNATEQTALDTWIRAGGGILMYSDSAAGGKYNVVGIRNPTGQNAVNSILSKYGMQVTVDQGGGIRAYTSLENATNPIVWDNPVFEGEGVSPVAVDPNKNATVLIPLDDANKISGSTMTPNTTGISISNPQWACMAHCSVGDGNIIASFDRQPMWNNGPGSDINKKDNKEILRRIIRFLARDYGNSSEWLGMTSSKNLELTYRQWSGGSGKAGYDYTAHNAQFSIQQKTNLLQSTWSITSNHLETVRATPNPDGETEQVTVRILPEASAGFARVVILPHIPPMPLSVDAGMDLYIEESGSAKLEATASGATTIQWSKQTGPGSVMFANRDSLQTTATFSLPGTYELALTAGNGSTTSNDTLVVQVVDAINIVQTINCGGYAYAGNNGFSYSADSYFVGGKIDNFPGNAVARTDDDALYNVARSGQTAYNIPVTDGNYTVYLQFAETYFTAANKRVSSVSIEGASVITNLDLFDTAPGKWVAYDLAFPVAISDGTLNITFSASVNNSLLNALVVIKN